MTSRPLILAALLTCAVPPCAAPQPPAPLSPPGVCMRLTADQLLTLALAIAADGHTVETPCLEITP